MLDQRVDGGNDGERQHGRGDHAADHRCRAPAHPLGAGAGAPEDGQQAGHDGSYCHHLRADPLDGAFHDGGVEIGGQGLATFGGATGLHLDPGVIEVDQHDDAGFGSDAGQRDEADGRGDRQVVAEPPHQPDAADQRERHREHDDQRFGDAPEIEVEEQEDDEQRDRHDDLQLGDGAFHVLELAAPGDVGAGGEFDLLVDRLPRLGDIEAYVAVADIYVDVGREQRVFGAN